VCLSVCVCLWVWVWVSVSVGICCVCVCVCVNNRGLFLYSPSHCFKNDLVTRTGHNFVGQQKVQKEGLNLNVIWCLNVRFVK